MNPIFYNSYYNRVYFATDVAPISIIRTDSSDTIPECILTLSAEYKPVINIGYFISFTDEEKIYQITDIEETYGTEVNYTITAQEVGALICSNRIAPKDTFSETEDYLQTYLGQLINGGIAPSLTQSRIKYEIKGDNTIRASQIWEEGSTLFDYIQKEAENHKAIGHFFSNIARVGLEKWIVLNITVEAPQTQPKIFLPSDKISSFTIQTAKPEYNAFDYAVTIMPYADFTYNHKGRVVPKFTDEESLVALNCIQKEVDVSPSKLTLKSFCKFAGIKVNDAGVIEPYPLQLIDEAVTNKTVYLYVKPNATAIKCKAYKSATEFDIFTVDALQILFADIEDYTALRNSGCYCTGFSEALKDAKNGAKAGYQYLYGYNSDTACWELAEPTNYKTLLKKNYKYNGNYYYMLSIVTLDGNPLKPFTSTAYCIAANSEDTDPRYDATYLKPIVLSALEIKAIGDIPKEPARNITVEFAKNTEAKTGEELQIIAGKTLFKGVVSAVTQTIENGEESLDIEVKEWEEA